MKKKNLFVTLANENYVEQAKQLFSSAYWNAGWKGDYMLLAHKIPEKKLKWFRNKGILVRKYEPLQSSERLNKKRWPPVVFTKFYLFTPYFKKWENIVYLDADIIVRASLDELTRVNGFAAVKGHDKLSKLFLKPLHIIIENRNKKIYKTLEKTYNLNEPSFNSGVLAFNTSIIKKNTFSELKQMLIKYIKISEGDDNILNLFFYKKWTRLSKVYNLDPFYLTRLYNTKAGNVNGIILHFYEHKPWNPKNPFYQEWRNNLEKAELINLKKIPEAKVIITEKEARDYEHYLKKRKFYYPHKYFFWRISIFIKRFISECISLVGIYIKKHFPRLYFKLKKLKDKF